jgi:hypothetical protein
VSSEPSVKNAIPAADEESLWTVEDVARFFQVHPSWVYERTRKGSRAKSARPKALPHVMVGRYPRFLKEDVIEYAKQMKRDYPKSGRVN